MTDKNTEQNFDVFTGSDSSRQQIEKPGKETAPPNHNVFSEQQYYKVSRAKIVESKYVRKPD